MYSSEGKEPPFTAQNHKQDLPSYLSVFTDDVFEQLVNLEKAYAACSDDHAAIRMLTSEVLKEFSVFLPEGLATIPNAATRKLISEIRAQTQIPHATSHVGSSRRFILSLLAIILTLADFARLDPRESVTSNLRGRAQALFLRAAER